VTGTGRYVADVRLPGLLRGAVVHPRGTRQRLAQAGIEGARAMPGVVAVVAEDGFCGVVTERDDQLFPALHALEVEWTEQPPSQEPPYAAILRRNSDDSAVWKGAAIRRSAQYHAPHIAHGSILPRAAVADVRQDEAHLYVATQRPFGLRDRVAALLGLAIDQVHVHPQLASGMYGRGNIEDASIEAVRLSRAAGRPVLVEWSRGEEFRLSRHRPKFDADVAAALDRNGRLVAWRYHARTNPHLYTVEPPHPGMHEMSAGRNALPPYALGCADIRLTVEQADVPTAAFRSLGASLNVFAIESFIDELAEAAREDSIAFRLAHIDDPRLARVLEVVRERSGWARQRPAGIGLGVACAIYHGTYIAQVTEVAMRAGRPVLERAWCAVDAGRMVHVDGARNQIEGGIQQAASWTLLEELRQEAGVVQSASWRDYPIAR
jgi:CO/xanthine dehydrogenase Mo-binding subunit